MFKVSFNFKEFDDFIVNCQKKANRLEKLKNNIGYALVLEIHKSFSLEKSPYGEKWKPLKYRSGKTLQDTRGLYNGIQHKIEANNISVFYQKKYGDIHQYGTKKVPRRQFMPIEGQALPQHYVDVILSEINGFLDD